MRSLALLDSAIARRIEVVAFDLDDTLLTDGRLVPSVYSALGELAEAGLHLVAVTGRPLGYGEVIARLFRVLGVVVENGALAVRARDGALTVYDPIAKDERARRAARLEILDRAVRAAVPNAAFSDDMPRRHTEITYDVNEHRHLSEPEIATMIECITAHGAWATRSSVHVHASFDRTNKAEGLLAFLRATRIASHDAGAWRQRILFVGDSGNDAACFAGFPYTVGVANVRHALARLNVPPRWITEAEKGAGFRELAQHLLRVRRD